MSDFEYIVRIIVCGIGILIIAIPFIYMIVDYYFSIHSKIHYILMIPSLFIFQFCAFICESMMIFGKDEVRMDKSHSLHLHGRLEEFSGNKLVLDTPNFDSIKTFDDKLMKYVYLYKDVDYKFSIGDTIDAYC